MVTNHTPMFLGKNVISPLFVDRFGRSLQYCYLEFDKEAIFDDFMAHSRNFKGREVDFIKIYWAELLWHLWTLYIEFMKPTKKLLMKIDCLKEDYYAAN